MKKNPSFAVLLSLSAIVFPFTATADDTELMKAPTPSSMVIQDPKTAYGQAIKKAEDARAQSESANKEMEKKAKQLRDDPAAATEDMEEGMDGSDIEDGDMAR